MKKYFCYLLKKNLLPLACLTLCCVMMYVVPMSINVYSFGNDVYTSELYYENISIVLGIMSVLIPIYVFSYKMNKRSVDLHYSLPLSKTKILVANFLMGLILLYASYSIAYWWGFITVAIKVKRIFLIYYLYLYLASLIPAFITYSVTAFIFTRANTIIDGIISVAGAMCMLLMAVAMVTVVWNLHSFIGDVVINYLPFAPLGIVTTQLGDAIWQGNIQNWFLSDFYDTGMIDFLINGILWTLISIASTIGLILTEKHAKAENCGQISDSIFCYKVQIPAYLVMSVAAAMATSEEIILLCTIVFCACALSVIYKRTFKIGWKYAVVLVACFVSGILLSLTGM